MIGADTVFVLPGGTELVPAITNGTIDPELTGAVVDRHIFYNESYFDGNDPAASANDDNAIATDKVALLPGDQATFANYTSYSRGINGIMVDILNLADSESLNATNFEFRVGNTNEPSTWSAAPAPSSVTVRGAAGVQGSDRVTLIWEDGAIQKQWLEVTIKPDAVTGLADPDVFYIGNAVGESGNSPANTFVDGTDFAVARDNVRNFLNRASIDFAPDYNRDSFVDGSDQAIARDNNTSFLTDLELLDVSGVGRTAGSSLQVGDRVVPASQQTEALTQSELEPLMTETVSGWAELGLAAEDVAGLSTIEFVITDLPGPQLGWATQETIYIDRDGGGYGWFVDLTPGDNEEFLQIEPSSDLQAIDPAAIDRIDLLSVLYHELGHSLGLEDEESSVDGRLVSGELQPGVHREPSLLGIDAYSSRL